MRRWLSSESYRLVIERLVEARADAGLTQREVARAVGRPRSFVAKIEVGERRLDVLEFIAICRAVSIPPGKLIGELDGAIKGQMQLDL